MTERRERTIVTGAAGFIGNAVAQSLWSDGHEILALDRSFDHAPPCAEMTRSDRYRRCEIDVSNEADWAGFSAGLPDPDAGVTGLVTVAAINRVGPVADYVTDDWDAMMAVNVRGVFLAVKYSVPLMRRAGGGSIVNMSSVSAFIGTRGGFAYHCTKGAVLSMSRGLALELADDEIRVNCVCPGWVDTPFTDRYLSTLPDADAARSKAENLHALGRFAKAGEVAEAVRFLLSPSAGFMTGTELVVDGGFMIRKE